MFKKNGHLIVSEPDPIGIQAKVLIGKWQGYRYDHISLHIPHQWRKIIQNSGIHLLDLETISLSDFY